MEPLTYALIVMGVGWIMDNIYDTFFSPRFIANVLEVHPAVILVGVVRGIEPVRLLGHGFSRAYSGNA